MSTLQKIIRNSLVIGLLIGLVLVAFAPSLPRNARAQDPASQGQKIESDEPAILQEGTWVSQPAPAASGGSYLYNSGEARLILQFIGPSLEVLYVAGPSLGTLAIEVDGVVLRTVITTDTEVRYQQSAKIDYLTDETHTLKVYAQAGGVIGVDAFMISRPVPPIIEAQDSSRLASPECNIPAPVRRMVIPLDGDMSNPYSVNFPQLQLTGDGQFIVFTSWLRNLLPNLVYPHGSNLYPSVYRVNTQTCQIELVSEYANGDVAQANLTAASEDGRYITFRTEISLVPADTNNTSDIYLRDMASGVLTLVSRNAQGEVGNGTTSVGGISRNGRFIVFSSTSSNLHPADTSNDETMFIVDQQSGLLDLVPDSVTVDDPNEFFGELVISDDGRYVAYQFPVHYTFYRPPPVEISWQAWVREVFVTDRQTQTSRQITEWHDGSLYEYGKTHLQITADGRYIFFESPEYYSQNAVYVYDNVTMEITQAAPARFNYWAPETRKYGISNDGRYIVYAYFNSLYLLDRQTTVQTLLSNGYDGEPMNDLAILPGVSNDGRYVIFESQASNVVPNDSLYPWQGSAADAFLVDTQQVRPFHTSLTAYGPYARRVDLWWTQHSPLATQFEVQRLQPGFGNNWEVVGTTPAGATTFSDANVTLGAAYYYRLRVLTPDPNYSLYSTAEWVMVDEDLLFASLYADSPGAGEVSLTWHQYQPTPTATEIFRYIVYGPDNEVSLGVVPSGVTSFSDTTVVCGTTYFYFIHALTPDPDYYDYSMTASITTMACHTDTIALFRTEYNWMILMSSLLLHPPQSDYHVYLPNPPDLGEYIMGDWDGDGDDTPGVYSASGAFWYTNELGNNTAWSSIWIGLSGRPIVAGHFSAAAPNDCIGVIDQFATPDPRHGYAYALYYTCDLTHGPTPPLTPIWLGAPLPDDLGLQGAYQFSASDFNGDGVHTVAARRENRLAWTNAFASDGTAVFGPANEIYLPSTLDNGLFVVGNWDGDAASEFGLLYQNGRFYYSTNVYTHNALPYQQSIGLPFGAPFTAAVWESSN